MLFGEEYFGGSMKIHEFNLTPYPRKLWVIKKWTEEELKEAFCRYDGGEIDWDLDDSNSPFIIECRKTHRSLACGM